MIYVGQTNAANQPNGLWTEARLLTINAGNGYLYFNNGDLHEGLFEGGRAHGEGVLLTAKGDEYRGEHSDRTTHCRIVGSQQARGNLQDCGW
jgi:hypothetical protein